MNRNNIIKTLIKIFLSTSFLICQESFNIDDIVIVKDRYKKKFSDITIDGEIYKLYGNKKLIVGSIKNGKKNGLWIKRLSQDFISRETFYTDGLKEGAFTHYFSNGKIKRKGQHRNNLINGKVIQYKRNGEIDFEGIYSNGKCMEGVIKKLKKRDDYLVYVSEIYQDGKLTTMKWIDETNGEEVIKNCTKNECD